MRKQDLETLDMLLHRVAVLLEQDNSQAALQRLKEAQHYTTILKGAYIEQEA